MLSLVVIVVIYGGGLIASFVAPYSYTAIDIDRAKEGPSAGPLAGH